MGVSFVILEDGFKYMGYFLKANCYRIVDWYKLVNKFEKRIIHRTNRWLSLGGILILVKAVLQNIPVYWSTLAKFTSYIKQRIRKSLHGE